MGAMSSRIRKGSGDGYTTAQAALVTQFQSEVERNPQCNYDALRHALSWARGEQEFTLFDLYAKYFEIAQ